MHDKIPVFPAFIGQFNKELPFLFFIKLFAILVITAMVLALLPVTAFASNPLDYSAAASTVTVDKTSVTAGDEVEFTVRFRAANGAAWTTEASFFFKSSRDAEEVTTTGAVTVKTVETTPRSITVLTGAELNAGVSVVTTGLTTADGVLKTPKDAATEKVFITRDDIQVTITIGSYVIEVVRDGVAETVTSDVAAFIKDGRTFLPLRVIGEIFGAEFDWGPKDAATEWVSFTQ